MLRRILLAASFILGLSSAFAQAPPPVPALPDTDRLTAYSISGTLCNCAVGFALYGDGTDFDAWVKVYVNGTPRSSSDPIFGWQLYSLSGYLGSIPLPVTDAVLHFNNPQTGTVQIVGARRPRRLSQFPENRGVTARDLNQAITDIVAQNREEWDQVVGLFGGVGWPPARSGTTNTFASVIGTLSNGHCITADSSGDLIDGGGACVSSSSGVSAGTAGQLAYYATSGSVVSGLTYSNSSIGVPTFANPAALAAATIVASVNIVAVTNVSGAIPPPYAAAGQSFCGVSYLRGTGAPAGLYGEVLNVAAGIYWEPIYSTSPVRACEFGTIGDGTFDKVTGAITGTDNTAIIQAALDFTLRSRFNTVCLNDGMYKTTNTIQMGWGDNFYSVSLVNCNRGGFSYNGLAGPTLLPTKIDRCAINITGGRNDKIEGLTIWGQNWVFLSTSGIGSGTTYPSLPSGWIGPSLIPTGNNPGGLQRHSPYAGICIDAYKGAAPLDAYPNVTFPVWTGLSAQYNKLPSSATIIKNNQILGFGVAIAASPNGDGNGDFILVDHVDCTYSVWCFAVGNTQARNNQLYNLFNGLGYGMVTNTDFGLGEGQLGGPMMNFNCQCYEIFKVSTAFSGAVVFTNIYQEASVRLGEVIDSGGQIQGITINGCTASYDITTTHNKPSAIIHNNFGTGVTLTDCKLFANDRGGVLMDNGPITINGGQWNGASAMLQTLFPNSVPLQNYVNFTGGYYAGSSAAFPNFLQQQLIVLEPIRADYWPTLPPPGAIQILRDAVQQNGNRVWLNQANKFLYDSTSGKKYSLAINNTGGFVSISANATVAPAFPSCDLLTFTWPNIQQNNKAANTTFLAGDILYNQADYSLFVILTVGPVDGSGNWPITARQLNNMITDNTGACVTNTHTDPGITGNVQVQHTQTIIPTSVYYGDFTAASPNVANIHRGDGASPSLTSSYQNGDIMLGYLSQCCGNANGLDTYLSKNWPFAYGTTLSAVTNGSPGTMTLSNPALTTGRFPILPVPITGQ
jgi:hypothetical protein